MKIPVILTFILFLSAFQVLAFEAQRDDRGVDDMRDPRGSGDMRDPRGEEDTRGDRYGGDGESDDRPWRETLKNCREMKKAGTLSSEMKKECKAARELRKASKQ